MPVNEQLKNMIDNIKFAYKLKQSEVAVRLGVTGTYLSDMINGRVPFTDNMREKIHEVFTDYSGEESSDALKETKYYGGEYPEKPHLIPLYDDVATSGGSEGKNVTLDSVSRPTDYIDAGDWFRNGTAAIRHYGNSMIEYPPGCIIVIKEVFDRELIIPGRDYVIETAEYRTTKRVQRGKDNEHITAYSTNTETYPDGRLIHEPFDVPWRAIRHISLVLGYVVKKNGGTIIYSNSKQ